jgi:hypothetical protein
MGWFRVTSLKPINPANRPDPFEQQSLLRFQQGAQEQVMIERGRSGRVLRYAAPLITEKSCLGCHSEHGYHPGEIRGTLSVTIPIGWAEKAIHDNNRTILLLGILSVGTAAIVMLLLFNRLVAHPIGQLTQAMAAFPEKPPEHFVLPRAACLPVPSLPFVGGSPIHNSLWRLPVNRASGQKSLLLLAS